MYYLKTLIFVFFLCKVHSQSTDSLYALREEGGVIGGPPTVSSLYKVDPISGNSTHISTANFSFNGPFSIRDHYASKFVDPVRNKYCFIALPGFIDSIPLSGSSFRLVDNFTLQGSVNKDILVSVDLTTGIWEGVVLEDSHLLQYNCADSTYYALRVGGNFSSVSLVKIDPETGYSSAINSVTAPIVPYTFQGSPTQQAVIDHVNRRFIFHGAPFPLDGTGIPHIYSIDLVTGSLVGDYLVNDIDAIHAMAFNCRDTSIYGIEVGYSPNERYLVKVDPITFATSRISQLPYDVWYDVAHPLVITVSNNKYVFLGYNDLLTEYSVYSFDIEYGTLTNSPEIDVGEVLYIASYPVCKITPNIEHSSCSGTIIDFKAPSGGSAYDWDFGDPMSSNENSSNLKNPTHQFSSEGTYIVKLVMTSCYTTDSITKTIIVDSVQSLLFNFGPDRELCPGDVLQLSVPNNSNSIEWQDGSQTTEYLVSDGGTYICQVSDSLNCLYSDTINITYKPEGILQLNYINDSLIATPNVLDCTWFLNNTVIDTSGVNSLLITSSGDYSLIGSIDNCIYKANLSLESEVCEFIMSPNPTQGILTLNSSLNELIELDVVNMNGEVVERFTNLNSSLITLDVSSLASGLYLLRSRTDKCEVKIKFVKL